MIIEDLGEYVLNTNSTVEHQTSSVVFYFFDKRRGSANHSADAIRAMLAQLVHLHRHNEQAIDIASVILAKNITGQFTATDNEILAVLGLLLDQLGPTYLVFEGLAECSDHAELFKSTAGVASRSNCCAILLLGRPTVHLPANMQKESFSIHLTHLRNTEDMKRFLRPEIQELVDTNFLPHGSSVDKLIELITLRAKGMFLWVRLLVEYLRLPSLTLRDRLDAIKNLNRLEGLNSLYDAVLEGLETQFSGQSRINILRVFQWIAHSQRPLKVDELCHAVSVPTDRAQTKEDLIPRFEKYLGSLSGSLIELSNDNTVQFIHLSTQEYFTGTRESPEPRAGLKILTYHNSADRCIAISCLSYLNYTVPAEPLGGSTHIMPNLAYIRHKYPLLKYSVEYWTKHLVCSLTKDDFKELYVTEGRSWPQLAKLVHLFLSEKRKVSMWIEASWLEKRPPSVSKPPEVASLSPNLVKAVGDSFHQLGKAITDLKQLRIELKTLNKSWSHVLRSEPNEIWEPSVLAFTESHFWLNTTDARVIRLAPLKSNSRKCITLQSQVSVSGIEIGLIRLIPSA